MPLVTQPTSSGTLGVESRITYRVAQQSGNRSLSVRVSNYVFAKASVSGRYPGAHRSGDSLMATARPTPNLGGRGDRVSITRRFPHSQFEEREGPMKNLRRNIIVLVGLGAALFVVSGIFKNDDDGWRWIAGGIGWFGFLICVLSVLVLGVVAFRRRHRPTTV